MVQDKLEDSQRQQDKDFDLKLVNAIRAFDQKITGDMQTFVDRSIKTHGDEIRIALGDAQTQQAEKFNNQLRDVIGRTHDDWNG